MHFDGVNVKIMRLTVGGVLCTSPVSSARLVLCKTPLLYECPIQAAIGFYEAFVLLRREIPLRDAVFILLNISISFVPSPSIIIHSYTDRPVFSVNAGNFIACMGYFGL